MRVVGIRRAMTALPQPPNTSQNVPMTLLTTFAEVLKLALRLLSASWNSSL